MGYVSLPEGRLVFVRPGLVLGEGKKSHLKCNLLCFFWGEVSKN